MDPKDQSGDIYEKSGENLEALKELYPRQFDCEHIGRDWPDGWHSIVASVCEHVASSVRILARLSSGSRTS